MKSDTFWLGVFVVAMASLWLSGEVFNSTQLTHYPSTAVPINLESLKLLLVGAGGAYLKARGSTKPGAE